MKAVTVSVQANSERREDGGAIGLGPAVDRFFDMFEAGLHGHTVARKKRELRGVPRQTFERGKAIRGRELANGIHARVQIER